MSYPVGGKGGEPAAGTMRASDRQKGTQVSVVSWKPKKDYFKEKMVNSTKASIKRTANVFIGLSQSENMGNLTNVLRRREGSGGSK